MNYFKLFANCIVVSGIKNAIICDLQKNESELIPVEIGNILDLLNSKTSIEQAIALNSHIEQGIIQSYIDYIQEKGYGFYCNENDFDLFPDLNTNYEVPHKITNAIIERTPENISEIGKIIDDLESLDCQHISIVFYKELSIEMFHELFKYFHERRFKSFDVVSKWSTNIDPEFLNRISKNIQLSNLSFFGCPTDLPEYDTEHLYFEVFFSTENVKNFSHCGKVNIQSFNTNLTKVLEAMNFNSCLYKKISIDINGNIKNCPAIDSSFGNIKDLHLKEVLEDNNFKKYWNLKKDSINICNECEFRYICTDCRAYTEQNHTDNAGLDTSKPLKCGYSPKEGIWEEWSTNPLKQKAIQYYGIAKY